MNKYSNLSNTGQVNSNKVRLTFAFIILLTIFSALVVFKLPSGFAAADFFNKYKVHLGLDLQGGTHLVYEADTSLVESSLIDQRLDSLRDRIEKRVNPDGLNELVVQTNKSGDSRRIIVELPGIKDVNEAIQIIGKVVLLDFRTQGIATEDNTGEEIVVSEDGTATVDLATNPVEQNAQEILTRALAGEDFTALAEEYSEDIETAMTGGELPWKTKDTFVDENVFDNLKIGEIYPELIKSQYGYHIIKKLDERLNADGILEAKFAQIAFKYNDADLADFIWNKTELTGKNIEKANLNFNPNTNAPFITVTFNEDGKEIFAKLTEDNIGKPLGIFLDNELISAPTVNEAIRDGEAQITGGFTIDEAKQLVKDLNEGALPMPIELISQNTIGASLGEESLAKSLMAGIIGLIAAALFMIIFYRLPGLVSVFALIIYTLVTLMLFEIIPVTMTLAGVAGFILSIGMAVDANILIFERTKEELKSGKSLHTAVENGFVRAWSSIRDSNISSIITCIILAWFGTSIIKGFAITLAIGILVSMFSAITVTRSFLRMLVSQKMEGKLWLFGSIKKD